MRNIINLNNDQQESTCLFGDDLAYMISFKNKEKDEAINKAKFYFDGLNECLNKWRLRIAPHKSSYIVFSRYKKGGTQEKFEIHLDGKMIPEEKAPKFLGIKFDKFLSFKNQVENIKNKAYSRMSILKIMSYDKHMRVNEKVLLRLYKSLIRSVIEYKSILVNSLSEKLINQLEVIQNNCLRIIYKVNRMDLIRNEDLRTRAKLPTIKTRLNSLANKYLNKTVATQPIN